MVRPDNRNLTEDLEKLTNERDDSQKVPTEAHSDFEWFAEALERATGNWTFAKASRRR